MPEKASWNFAPDTEIAAGRWILEQLGGGNRYEVFLVWDEKLFSPVVAKVVRPDRVEDERVLRAFRREAELLDRLSHPVLVRGFGALLDGPYPHLLIEELEGPTLRRLIDRHGPLPLEQLVPLALHVASALHYLSTEQVVHFDVKPGNVVMTAPPRLIDLSLARTVEDAAELAQPIGTHVFTAPEVCEAPATAAAIGPAADIWGLGGTLYQAITGELPFPRDEEHAQLTREPQPLAGRVPDGLASLVMRMLAKDPAERPPAREVATVLEPFAG